MSKRKSSSRGGLWFTCLCLLALLSGCARVGAASGDSGPSAPGPDDGPYAFYSGEAGLDLYWLCGGELVEHRQGVGEPVPAKCGFPKSVVAGPPADADPQVRFEADRIAALSDIHGQFDVLVELLRNNGVIGEDLDWAFGDGHLVVAGDMFDRGGRQTGVLWLLYRLEQQAQRRERGRIVLQRLAHSHIHDIGKGMLEMFETLFIHTHHLIINFSGG